MTKTKGRKSELELVAKNIRKDFGNSAFCFGREDDTANDLIRIPTGLFTLDVITGGGYPKGKILEIHGWPGVGKTMAALRCIAANQDWVKEEGRKTLFLDVEGAFNYDWAESLGVKTDRDHFVMSRADYGENYLEILDRAVRSGGVGLAILDSVAALSTKEEVEKDMSESSMAKQAQLMSKALKKLGPSCLKTDTTIIFINQMRASMKPFGKKLMVPGGWAREYWIYLMVEMRYGGMLSENAGHIVHLKTVKNKTAAPHKEASFDLIYKTPAPREYEVIKFAESMGVLDKKRNGYYFLEGENIGRINDAIGRLREGPKIREKIEKQIIRLQWGSNEYK